MRIELSPEFERSDPSCMENDSAWKMIVAKMIASKNAENVSKMHLDHDFRFTRQRICFKELVPSEENESV